MRRLVALAFLAALAAAAPVARAEDPCLDCHTGGALDKPRLDVKVAVLAASVHGKAGIGCADCHQSLAGVTDFPHGKVAPVDCGSCHAEIAKTYDGSLHGQEVRKGAKLAPRCVTCHGGHDVTPVKSPDAKVARARIPFLCGSCHKEGTPVTRTYDIPQDKILSTTPRASTARGS